MSLITGFLWIPFLFKDVSCDVGSPHSAQGAVFLSLGTVLPFGAPRILIEFVNIPPFGLFLVGLGTYLFLGLMAGLSMRYFWGCDFFPVITLKE